MTFDPNDPRLTAYVLGEVDPAERSEIDAMLESSSEARQAVEEIRRTIGWLTDHLRDEQATHTPAAESNHRPLAVVSPPSARVSRPWWRRPPVRLASLAALLLIAATAGLLSLNVTPDGPLCSIGRTARCDGEASRQPCPTRPPERLARDAATNGSRARLISETASSNAGWRPLRRPDPRVRPIG